MLRYLIAALGLLIIISCKPKESPATSGGDVADAPEIPEWFIDGKFGMFIHWGPYSVFGGEWKNHRIEQGDIAEWIMHQFQIPVEEYRKTAATFNPSQFNAKEWVELAKSAGMKYIIVTSKHHDGFAMYHSEASDYNIVDYTPFGRDPLKELSEACAEAGLKFCVYYSHREDWDHPYAYGNTWDFDSSQTNLDTMDHPELFREYLDEKAIPQLRELLTNYGPLGIVWFDRGMYTQEQGREFADLVHSLQPGCLVNGRVGHYDKELLGDYQSLTDNGMPAGGIEEYWETPQTLNDTWGYSKFDENWKSPEEIIRRMAAVVSKGGNYLLNIGPTGEGVIPGPSVDILKRVGEWISQNGASIYGTSPSPFPYELPWGYCTRKGSLLYLHVFEWPHEGVLNVNGLNNRINTAYLLANPGEPLSVHQDEEGDIRIQLPDRPENHINTVAVIEISGEIDVDPFIIQQEKNDTVSLGYISASTFGKAVKRFNRKGESGHFHISKMQGPEDIIQWHVQFNLPGIYDVVLDYAATEGWEDGSYILETDHQRISGSVESTPGWYDYRRRVIGRLTVPDTSVMTFSLYPEEKLDHYLMHFRSVELVPVSN